MAAYTYLVDSTYPSPEIIQRLNGVVSSAKKNGDEREILFYGDNLPVVNEHRYIRHITGSNQIKSLQTAVITSSGEWIIFTTLEAILTEYNKIEDDISRYNDKLFLLPASLNFLEKKIGLRHLKMTPYVACRKTFIINFIDKIDSIKHLVRLTDHELKLSIIPDSQASTLNPVVDSYTFMRPYVAIFKRGIYHIKYRVGDYRRRKRAYRLSRNVLRVKYSNDIPVFIICRDRVTPLKKLVKWLEDENLKNIFFIDNASTYPPLLEYFRNSPYQTIRLNVNAGHTAPWQEGIVQLYAADKPFIVTDPDVIPSQEAHGAVKLFARLLNDHLERIKVGFGLRIDNLPDSYDLKQHVISWEKQFWVSEVETDVYDAETDTTFALYRPGTPYVIGPALRTGGVFVAEHEPWYIDSKNVNDEVKYYREHADKIIGSWGIDGSDISDTYAVNSSHLKL
ncbi:MAG: hypothetical protein ABIQ04_04320 [Candidatus Saccharimonadales bacterium]